MLVISRKVREQIMLGDNVTITIVGISPNKVRVGVTAPHEVPVHRGEVQERIEAEKKDDAARQAAEEAAPLAGKAAPKNLKKPLTPTKPPAKN